MRIPTPCSSSGGGPLRHWWLPLLLLLGQQRCRPAAATTSSTGLQQQPAAAAPARDRFPVTWMVGSGWDEINGSIPAPGWPPSLHWGWQCVHPGNFYPSVNVTQLFGVDNCTRIQCGPGCTNAPACQDWTQGLFPSLKGTSCQDAQPVNGGVPQAANLSAHLAELRRTVPLFIPDPDWDGMAVFDFEKWTNIWELMISPAPPGAWHSTTVFVAVRSVIIKTILFSPTS